MNYQAKKSFGQHFLNSKTIAQKIVAALDFKQVETVVEIGPGRGALTNEIVREESPRLILIEADRDLIADLRERYPSADVVEADAAKVDYDQVVGGSWSMIGNLPYNAANAIIMNALTSANPPREIIAMVQREVAERMLARPGQMSLLSVAVGLYSEPERVMNVAPGSFTPPPKVMSTVVKLKIKPENQIIDREAIIKLAKIGFQARRKQLQKNLVEAGISTSSEVKQTLAGLKIRPDARAQDLSIKQWMSLQKQFKIKN